MFLVETMFLVEQPYRAVLASGQVAQRRIATPPRTTHMPLRGRRPAARFCCVGLGPELSCLPGEAKQGQLLARAGFAGSPETKSSPRCTQLASASSAV